MARGGKQPGSGRPKGAVTRPQLRDFFTQEEIVDFVADLKEKAKTDPGLQKFIAEQIFGKAIQPVEGNLSGTLVLEFDKTFHAPSNPTSSSTGSDPV